MRLRESLLRLVRAFGLAAASVALVFATGCDDNALTATAQKVVFDFPAHAFTVDRKIEVAIDGALGDSGPGATPACEEWVETVRSLGDGKNVAVELASRGGKTRAQITDSSELAAFDRLAGQLAAGGGRRALYQRDPMPDDIDRLAQNYYISLVELGREPVVARGEPSLTYLLEPICGDRPIYLLTVSTAVGREGFPLIAEEYVDSGEGPRCVSRMTVLDAHRWKKPAPFEAPASPLIDRVVHESLASVRTRASELGLSLVLPKDSSLPSGFVLARAEEVRLRSTANVAGEERELTLFRFVYSDGLEHIDFIEQAPLDTLPQNYAESDFTPVAFVSRFASIRSASLLYKRTQVTIETRIAAPRFGALLAALVPL